MGVAKFCLTTAKKHNIYLSKVQASQFRQKFFLLYRGIAAYHQRIKREWQEHQTTFVEAWYGYFGN
jgi:DNA polymerase-1